jgi:GT2 family glycosyltransferase
VPGACLLVRRGLLEELGPFDEDYFVWFEDVDWCFRAQRNLHRAGYCEEAVFFHEGGRSFEPLPRETRKKWFYRSLLRYFRKHKGTGPWLALGGCLLAEEAVVFAVAWGASLAFPRWKTMQGRRQRSFDLVRFLLAGENPFRRSNLRDEVKS